MNAKNVIAGAQRACLPGETLERMRPHFDSAGISRVAMITGLDRMGIPVAQCVRPDARLLSVDSGKGATVEQAMASAVMEGFERHVGETWCPEIVDCGGEDVRCVQAFPKIEGSGSCRTMEWTMAHGILSGSEYLVPAQAAIMAGSLPDFSVFCSWSNGLSAGNTRDEAIVGGLYEVIERDAAHLALMSEHGRRVDGLLDPVALGLAGMIEEAGCKWIVLDVTSEIGVPVYEAYIYDFEDPCAFVAHGSGAHLCPAVAQARALCEAAQARAVWMAGSRDDIGSEKFHMARAVDARDEYHRLASKCVLVKPDRHEDRSGAEFADDIDTLVTAVVRAGLPEPMAMDLPHNYPCSVVKVMGAGMAGYFGHGCKWVRPL